MGDLESSAGVVPAVAPAVLGFALVRVLVRGACALSGLSLVAAAFPDDEALPDFCCDVAELPGLAVLDESAASRGLQGATERCDSLEDLVLADSVAVEVPAGAVDSPQDLAPETDFAAPADSAP
ncbi:hypothetical protein [Mycobacteroides stephanolepidis]|uniref:hypothetical protein n=1 Tax=[Mycobacterium] stephanolepidis TaxID=1520670 RepID=UPI000BBAD77C|nr:hypothetical protein [[Mycobacterium] stephanolepidis]